MFEGDSPNAKPPSEDSPQNWGDTAGDNAAGADREIANKPSTSTIHDTAAHVDALGFEPYVAAIAMFLTNSDTRPPLTLSIEGEWGSGKSSFMKQLWQKIADAPQGGAKPKIVWFNAWRHDQHEALWAAFALKFLEDISSRDNNIENTSNLGSRITYAANNITKDFKLTWLRSTWKKRADIIRILILDLLSVFIIFSWPVVLVKNWDGLTSELADQITCYFPQNENHLSDQESPPEDPSAAGQGSAPDNPAENSNCASSAINNMLSYLFLLVGGGGSIAGTLALTPKVLKSPIYDPKHDLKTYLDAPDYAKRVAFIEQFHQDFDKTVEVYAGKDKTGAPNKTYVFIDDIDRCELTKAAELMQAVYLMTADNPHIIFILGMDREKLAASIALRQKAILPYLQSSSVNLNGESDEKQNLSEDLEYGYTFIEKFVQLPFQVPRPSSDPKNLDKFFDALFDKKQAGNENLSEQKGLISHVSEPLTLTKLKKIVKIVAPALDYNPRRLKLFTNLVRIKGYLAWNTGFIPEHNSEADSDSQSSQALTLEQLGKFTAITLKWPLLLADVEREKTLLADLQRFAINSAAAKTKKDSDTIPDSLSCSLNNWKSEQTLIDLLRVGCCKGDPDRDRYSLETVNFSKLLEVSPPLIRDDFSSEKRIDYRKLQQLLQEQNWRAADRETYEVMIRAVGKESEDWFEPDELLNFPCTDLRTINDFWTKYSNGKFGFSMQKQIFVECGGKLDGEYSTDTIWGQFGERVGWRIGVEDGKSKWISETEATFSTSAPAGHLPTFRRVRSIRRGIWCIFSRIQTCEVYPIGAADVS